MHRLLIDVSPGEFVDHINGDKLDNRKQNLRVTDKAGNQRNQGIRCDNTSGYRGVYWGKGDRVWKAQITFNHKRIALGRFNNINDAALAYNDAARRYHGEFARLNTIKQGDVAN